MNQTNFKDLPQEVQQQLAQEVLKNVKLGDLPNDVKQRLSQELSVTKYSQREVDKVATKLFQLLVDSDLNKMQMRSVLRLIEKFVGNLH